MSGPVDLVVSEDGITVHSIQTGKFLSFILVLCTYNSVNFTCTLYSCHWVIDNSGITFNDLS